MLLLDTLSAEDSSVDGAIEMLHSLRMLLTQFITEGLFIVIFKFKRGLLQHGVFFNYFVQNVDVEGQAFSGLEILDQFAAHRASDSILVMQLSYATGAECVTAVHENSRDPFSDIELERAELANVETPRLVIKFQIHF